MLSCFLFEPFKEEEDGEDEEREEKEEEGKKEEGEEEKWEKLSPQVLGGSSSYSSTFGAVFQQLDP